MCFAIFAKIRKFKMAAIFGETKFLKIRLTTVRRYPVGQKFRKNRSILHGFHDTGIFVFCHFCKKFKMVAIFGKTFGIF